MEDLKKLITAATKDFASCISITELDNAKSKYLGKSGPLTEAMKGMSSLPNEDKPKLGALVNEVKKCIEFALNDRKELIQKDIFKEYRIKKKYYPKIGGYRVGN